MGKDSVITMYWKICSVKFLQSITESRIEFHCTLYLKKSLNVPFCVLYSSKIQRCLCSVTFLQLLVSNDFPLLHIRWWFDKKLFNFDTSLPWLYQLILQRKSSLHAHFLVRTNTIRGGVEKSIFKICQFEVCKHSYNSIAIVFLHLIWKVIHKGLCLIWLYIRQLTKMTIRMCLTSVIEIILHGILKLL